MQTERFDDEGQRRIVQVNWFLIFSIYEPQIGTWGYDKHGFTGQLRMKMSPGRFPIFNHPVSVSLRKDSLFVKPIQFYDYALHSLWHAPEKKVF